MNCNFIKTRLILAVLAALTLALVPATRSHAQAGSKKPKIPFFKHVFENRTDHVLMLEFTSASAAYYLQLFWADDSVKEFHGIRDVIAVIQVPKDKKLRDAKGRLTIHDAHDLVYILPLRVQLKGGETRTFVMPTFPQIPTINYSIASMRQPGEGGAVDYSIGAVGRISLYPHGKVAANGKTVFGADFHKIVRSFVNKSDKNILISWVQPDSGDLPLVQYKLSSTRLAGQWVSLKEVDDSSERFGSTTLRGKGVVIPAGGSLSLHFKDVLKDEKIVFQVEFEQTQLVFTSKFTDDGTTFIKEDGITSDQSSEQAHAAPLQRSKPTGQ